MTATQKTAVAEVNWIAKGKKQAVRLNTGLLLNRVPGNPPIWFFGNGVPTTLKEALAYEQLFDRYLKDKRTK